MIKSLEKLLRRGHKRSAGAKKRSGAANKYDSPAAQRDWRRIGAVSLIVVALSILMSVHLLPDKISLRLGDPSPREVRAARSVSYFNSVQTARLQQIARDGTPPVYDTDLSAAFDADRIVTQIFERLDQARATYAAATKKEAAPSVAKKSPASAAQTLATLQGQVGNGFSSAQLKSLLTVSPAIFQKLRATTARLVKEGMDRGIRDVPGDLRAACYAVETSAREWLSSNRDSALVGTVAAQALRPNRILNRARTEEARDAAARSVAPVYNRILRDEKVIGQGEIVRQEHLDKITALGLLNPRLEPTTGVAICVLAGAMVFLVAFYIARTLPVLYADTKRLMLLAIIVLVSVFGLKVGGSLLGLQFSGGQLGYLGMMSVAAAGMLVSVLLDRNLAVLIVALLSVQSGLIMNHEIRFTVMSLMSSLVGILTVGSARRKINLLPTTAALAIANLALVWLLGLLLNESQHEMQTGSVWAVASAMFATFLFWFGVLALEKPFGILTHATLLELSAFDRPLLKQLCAVAPGTYAHSMMVGTLAEAGAQAIGADALLCRVGGYYHDIGKMKRPEFFVENQRRENVHGRLSPSLSALIITAHVRDGVEMAREHKLPQDIRDIIAQHHGTTLIRYFYHQALMDNVSEDTASPGLEERFRYPGPKPQTREAAVVMLADSVEAAARCLDKPSTERLQNLIAGITREKVEDGQFDACSLTFQDMRGMTDAFLHVLAAMMHGRIDYPETPRTATGKPMEVVRPDLRPEPLSHHSSDIELFPGESGLAPLAGEAESEVHREIAAHLEVTKGLEYVNTEDVEATEAVSPPVARRNGPTPPSLSLPIVEPEVLYGRYALERAEASGADDFPASGSRPPASGGKPDPRGSERPPDR